MPTYAIAHLRTVDMNAEIVRYLQEIDATLEPFGGRFLVHGSPVTEIEKEWPGALVIVEFPDRERAEAWYASDAYQAILPLRVNNSDSATILVDGVPEHYRATSAIPDAA
jgi:uncharacterized protein (DUF1330 family)